MGDPSLKSKKILVLGCSGQVGQSFQKLLSGWPHVFFADRNPKSAEVRGCDFEDSESLSRLIEELSPEIVINCAAYTAVDLAEKETDLAFIVNSKAVGVLAKAAGALNAVFVHYSTDYVFDGRGTKAYEVDDVTNPVNAYGASKLAGEQEALKHCGRSYVFRTQWVYNRDGKNFVSTMLRLAAERDELSVVSDQIGAPTSSDVIAEYTLLSLQKIMEGLMPAGVYHLACRGEISWHAFAEEIFRVARLRGDALKVKLVKGIRTEDFPTPAQRPKNSRLALGRLESVLGTKLPDWKDALQSVLKNK